MRVEGNTPDAVFPFADEDSASPNPNGTHAAKPTTRDAATPAMPQSPAVATAALADRVQAFLAPLADAAARTHRRPESGPVTSTNTANDHSQPHVRTRRGGRLPPPGIAGVAAGATQVSYRGSAVDLGPSVLPDGTPEERQANAAIDSLYRPASSSQQITAETLGREQPPGAHGAPPANEFGTTMAIMASAASAPRGGSNLYDAADKFQQVHDHGGAQRETIHASIDAYQRGGEWNGDTRDLSSYIRHPGATGLRNGEALVDDLARHFSTPYNPHGETMGYPETFALVGFGDPAGRTIGQDDWRPEQTFAVQRLHAAGDYRHDSYALFNPVRGVYRYDNFNQLAYALSNYQSNYYGTSNDGSASTAYYAMQNVLQHPMAAQRLGDAGGSYGAAPLPALPAAPADPSLPASPEVSWPLHVVMPALAPPRADLPPPPDFDRPGPSGYQRTPHDEFRRSADTDADTDRQPAALYRPSIVTPEALKKLGGFSAEQTPLGNVNLDMHNFDVATQRSVIDGAGYLGTFRKLDTAQRNPALVDAKDGYVYAVAPSPGMVDVNASLGAKTRRPDLREVAAMGRIDYTQIRGWQKIENGKPGAFTANPDYRWDIYDQTRTAGAQPQLARFSSGDAAWGDSAHRPFAAQQQHDGKTVYTPRQESNLVQANFYHHALEKIQYLQERQAAGQDHRGPVELIAHNGAYGVLQANVHTPAGQVFSPAGPDSTDVTVTNRVEDASGYHHFRIGDDGRFHTNVLGEDEVLRVGGNGYLYLDRAPRDPHSTNGVFRYENNRLIHAEDGKVLTYSSAGYAYVSSTSYDSGYSQWKLTDSSNTAYAPPKHLSAYRDNSAGDARAQYEFDRDPDSALPPGVTHFATRMPDVPAYANTRSFMLDTTPAERQRTADWLGGNNAALLFRDGYYLVATGDAGLQVRNLQGKVVTTLKAGSASQDPASGLKSDYVLPMPTWTRIDSEQTRREQIETRWKTAYAAS